MKLQLDRAELAQRYRRQAADLTVQIASLLQGGILSAAAFSLIGIFQTQDDVAIRTMLWLISVVLGFVLFFRLCHRALLLMHPGADVLLLLPVLCLIEITLFAVLAAGAPGHDVWRYWYFGGATLFAAGAVANAFNHRSLRAEHYAEDAQDIFRALQQNIRRECIEGVAASTLTAALGIWLFVMPVDWPGASVVVGLHLLLTLVSGAILIAQDSREAARFRAL